MRASISRGAHYLLQIRRRPNGFKGDAVLNARRTTVAKGTATRATADTALGRA